MYLNISSRRAKMEISLKLVTPVLFLYLYLSHFTKN